MIYKWTSKSSAPFDHRPNIPGQTPFYAPELQASTKNQKQNMCKTKQAFCTSPDTPHTSLNQFNGVSYRRKTAEQKKESVTTTRIESGQMKQGFPDQASVPPPRSSSTLFTTAVG